MIKFKKIWIIMVAILILAGILTTAILIIHKKSSEITFVYNEEDVVGNSPGNLYNRGLICENNGVVYFANPYDSYYLYSMNADESNMVKLINESVNYINAAGDYLYFITTSSKSANAFGAIIDVKGLYRSDLNGNNLFAYSENPSGMIKLYGNSLYYQSYSEDIGMKLRSVSIDGTEDILRSNLPLYPASILNNTLYFSDPLNNHYLYQNKLDDNVTSTLLETESYNPIIDHNKIYFMNVSDNYTLYSYDLLEKTYEKITTESVDCYNIDDTYLYIQIRDNLSLIHI